ncbi:MAG TPA: sigma-70 family RNA polymerase sigma factor [Acidimicrobiales bacterium]|nr:sigma-70 family RNA polymerase sigma factor [Acidimicrobiales bacterium]
MFEGEEFERYIALDYSRLVSALWTVTGSRSVAEDLVQEALASALDVITRGRTVEDLASYVRVSAFNLSRNRWRRLWRERSALQHFGDRHQVGDTTSVVDDAVDIGSALAVLSRREREAVSLFYQLDLSVAETATAMGVSLGTVKTLLSRARAQMLKRLEPGRTEKADEHLGS